MTATPETAQMTAEQITARGNEIAPLDFDQQEPVDAQTVARWMAYHAQRRWTRNLSRYFDGTDDATRRAFRESIDAMCSEFAALHLLMALAGIDTATADKMATQLRNAWDDGGLIGELLYEHGQALGIDTDEVNRLEEAWQALSGVQAAKEDGIELARLRNAAQWLGRAVVQNLRAMEAARIELRHGDSHAAMQWILNSLPDVWDGPEGTAWDGKESAKAWFERTEAAYEAPSAPASVLPPPDRRKDRAEAAEAKLAAIASLCQERIDRYMANDPRGIGARFPDDAHVRAVDILAIISGEEAGNG